MPGRVLGLVDVVVAAAVLVLVLVLMVMIVRDCTAGTKSVQGCHVEVPKHYSRRHD